MNKNEEYDIVLPPDATFRRVYDFLPYTHWRLKQLLNDYCNAHLERIRAYKEGRYPGYRQRYNIYDNDTGKLIQAMYIWMTYAVSLPARIFLCKRRIL